MTQSLNQFGMAPIKGQMAALINPSTLSVQLDPDSSEDYLVPGDNVYVVDVSGSTITVDKCAADDTGLGFVLYTPKKNKFYPGDSFEIGCYLSIMWLEASAAFDRGVELEFVPTGAKVKEYAGTGNPTVGLALDASTGDGTLVRVFVRQLITTAVNTAAITITGGDIDGAAIGASDPSTGVFTTLTATTALVLTGQLSGAVGETVVRTKKVNVTRAEMNTGKEILPAVSGRKYRMIDCRVIAVGANAAATANATGVSINATQGASGVKLFEVNLAQLTRSAINRPGIASTLLLADNASFNVNDVNTAINAQAVAGSDLITVTSFQVEVVYVLES